MRYVKPKVTRIHSGLSPITTNFAPPPVDSPTEPPDTPPGPPPLEGKPQAKPLAKPRLKEKGR